LQELSTARDAILSAVPTANVRASQHSGHPVEVTVSKIHVEDLEQTMRDCLPEDEQWRMAPKTVLFQQPQRTLFRKNAKLRGESIKAIKEACEKEQARLEQA